MPCFQFDKRNIIDNPVAAWSSEFWLEGLLMDSDRESREQVLAAEAARREALMAADTQALGDMLADDYIYVHASGRVETKEAYLQSIGAGTFRLVAFSSADVTVNVYGQAAVVTGEISVTREEAKARKVSHFRFAAVWAKIAGEWRLALWQNTTKA